MSIRRSSSIDRSTVKSGSDQVKFPRLPWILIHPVQGDVESVNHVGVIANDEARGEDLEEESQATRLAGSFQCTRLEDAVSLLGGSMGGGVVNVHQSVPASNRDCYVFRMVCSISG